LPVRLAPGSATGCAAPRRVAGSRHRRNSGPAGDPGVAGRCRRSNANESAAIAALKCISSAQAQAQASAVIDVNHNDAGEYCFLAELAGAKGVRSDEVGGVSRSIITPPVMSSAFGTVVGSRVMRCGYWFQMYLPGPDGTGVAENPNGGGEGCRVAAGKAEVVWCCYAWPVECGASGKRAFFVNQAGDVLAADNATARYNGTAGVPSAGAAFRAGTKGHLDDAVAAN